MDGAALQQDWGGIRWDSRTAPALHGLHSQVYSVGWGQGDTTSHSHSGRNHRLSNPRSWSQPRPLSFSQGKPIAAGRAHLAVPTHPSPAVALPDRSISCFSCVLKPRGKGLWLRLDEKGSYRWARDVLCFSGTSVGEDLFVCKAPCLLYIFAINIVAVTDLLDPHVSKGTCVLTSPAPVEISSVWGGWAMTPISLRCHHQDTWCPLEVFFEAVSCPQGCKPVSHHLCFSFKPCGEGKTSMAEEMLLDL